MTQSTLTYIILPFNLFLYIKDFIVDFLKMPSDSSRTTFIYNGTEYDASGYADKHPGGKAFIENMKAERKDFTQYFRSLHSDQAQKILKSFPIVSQSSPSSNSQRYMQILKSVQHLYQPRWEIEALLTIFVALSFLTGCFTSIGILSIICFGFAQLIMGWMGHSMAHSRNPVLMKAGQLLSPLLGGLSIQWWSPKHNMHHMFTNSQLYDEDIQHNYKVYLFPFLYLKWRYDSLVSAIATKNMVDVALILINYSLLMYCRKNLIYFFLGELLVGFFSANVLIGNHEREKRYNQKIEISFIDHQIITCRNYKQNNMLWLILMGGMQFQTEHHLFPQIPFYNLPKAMPIIKEELAKINRSIVYGPVL